MNDTKPKRYWIRKGTGGNHIGECDDGQYVLASDYDALEAERDAFKAKYNETVGTHCEAIEKYAKLVENWLETKDELAALEADRGGQ